ncbi:MAG: hypothetical protein GTO29_08185 [Candidatus Latescibacteria bacterium]|nr:hypothetical protein [Candidatus Latescibacterota bacterium]NIO56140.1 hypothetical protein [Candidatus Latescibacterota bacterium]
MSEERVIGMVQKNELMQVRVTKKSYSGRDYIHVRQFVRRKDESEYKPTAKGIAIEIRQAPEICAVFEKLAEELERNK